MIATPPTWLAAGKPSFGQSAKDSSSSAANCASVQKLKKILVKQDLTAGVQVVGGEIIAADWVISASDVHATIYQLLDGKYIDRTIENMFRNLKTFPSYLQVSLGVAAPLSEQPSYVTRVLETPLAVDAETQLSEVSFRFFHFDPSFAPAGKIAITCFLPTRNFEFWTGLYQHDPSRYEAEKSRIKDAVNPRPSRPAERARCDDRRMPRRHHWELPDH